MEIKQIPIDKIKLDKNQPRQTIDQNKVKEMAQAIITEGVINPIELDEKFFIITGELRFRASKLAGLKTVPCKILKINPTTRFRRQVIENLSHNTMTDWDTAKAIKKLLQPDTAQGSIRSSKEKKGGLPDKGIHELSRIIGKSEKFIIEKLNLLEASQPFQEAVKKGMSASFIRAIKRTPEFYQKAMEEKIVRGEFKTRDEAIEVATALQRHPEKGEQILKAKNNQEVFKISPRYPDIMAAKLKPGQEFIRIQNELLEWLKDNPPQRLIQMDKPIVVLGLSVLIDKIKEWTNKTNQKQLT